MKRVVPEWPQRLLGSMMKPMGRIMQAQTQTLAVVDALRVRVEHIGDTVDHAKASRNSELAAENREYRKRLWNHGTRVLELEQARAASEERLYFALAERDRLESELRKNRLREDALQERLSLLREEAVAWHLEKPALAQERTELLQRVERQDALLTQAAENFDVLREEAQLLRQALRELSGGAGAGLRETSLAETNAALERQLWLAESEARAEAEALRAELGRAQERIHQLESEAQTQSAAPEMDHESSSGLEERLQHAEKTGFRLASENTMLSVILKERDDALARTEERLRRLSAAHDNLQHESAAARTNEQELREALAAAERQVEALLAQACPAPEWTPLPGLEQSAATPASQVTPWPGARVWSNPPESEPFGVRLGGQGDLEALAG